MIQGKFYHDKKQSPRLAISAVIEHSELFQQKASYELRQLFSKERFCSATIGSNESRSVICAHMSVCHGMGCSCHNVITHFLSQANNDDLDAYVGNNESYLKENIKSPYLLILAQRSDFVVITAYGVNDFQIAKLDGGSYDIRDCFLSVSSSDNGQAALAQWRNKDLSNGAVADQLGAALKEKLMYYPQKFDVDAQGITLLRQCQEAHSFHTVDLPAKEPEKETIKGPVSQYNFFSMESRKLIRDDSQAAQMPNNEWNRLVGQRWRELSAKEHEPFRMMALQDKKRYETECAAAGIVVEKRVRQTAYNHFVHQEKQFVSGTNVTNMKHKTGKYCSARWRAMAREEKQLYLALEHTGSKAV